MHTTTGPQIKVICEPGSLQWASHLQKSLGQKCHQCPGSQVYPNSSSQAPCCHILPAQTLYPSITSHLAGSEKALFPWLSLTGVSMCARGVSSSAGSQLAKKSQFPFFGGLSSLSMQFSQNLPLFRMWGTHQLWTFAAKLGQNRKTTLLGGLLPEY